MTRAALDADEAAALRALDWRPAVNGSACPDSSLLLAAEEGVLDDAALGARVRAHVESCSTCRQLAEDLALVLAEELTPAERARIDARIAFGRRPVRRAGPVWLGLGGLLAAAAVTAGVMFVPWTTWLATEPPVLPERLVVDATPRTTVFHGSRPTIPRAEPELTLRGDNAAVPLAEQIGQALDLADAGNLERAIAALDGIAIKNPRSADAHLALGATLLSANRPSDAVSVLERARSLAETASADEFDWFLAVALARTQNGARASSILESLCAKTTPRASSACAGLVELRRSAK